MRIAIISTMKGYSWAGTEEVWYHFAKHAMREGHEVMLGADSLVVASEQVKELEGLGLQSASRNLFRPMRVFLLKQQLFPDMRSIQAFSPDVVLLNSGSPLDHIYSPYIWEFCRGLNCPMVFFCHFNSDRLKIDDRFALAETFKQMTGVVFVSEDNRRVLERQLAVRLPNTKVILNSSRIQLDSPLDWPVGKLMFAQVARFEIEWKGHDILLEVLSQPEWIKREWTLTLFGSGPDEAYIRNLIKFYGLETRVEMGGYVRNMEDVYSRHHIILLPSRGEGTPLAALEAMMCGRPVVGTDVGGNQEIVDDGVSGFIAEAPTVRSFGRALERAWEARDELKTMGIRAHERARQLSDKNPHSRLLDFVLSAI